MDYMFGKKMNSMLDALKRTEAEAQTIKENMDDLYDILENEIKNSKFSDSEKQTLKKRLDEFCNTETNIMVVGATGCGKSSTINALFSAGEKVEYAKVGKSVTPETKQIEKYQIGNLVLWDTPGLGDGTNEDEHYSEMLKELLNKKDEDENAVIDLVLVILDGSTKDLGTTYKILNEVIIPELKNDTSRILIALNQADVSMKNGRHWNYEDNCPDEVLIKILEEKVQSIKDRVKKDSGIEVNPIYYCAGYKEETGDVVYPYNLSKLLYYIMSALPAQKRVTVMEGINTDSDNYEHNDEDEDYNEEIKESFCDSFDYISYSVDNGAEIGATILGVPGAIVGAVLGGVVGCVRSILDEVF